MDAGRTIRRARSRAGLSLRQLAALAATSHATIAAYEQGHKVPRVDTLARICRAAGFALDVDLDPRPAGDDLEAKRRALLDVLALADAYPFERSGPLEAPVFGRTTPGAGRPA